MNIDSKTVSSYNKSWYDIFWKNYKIPLADFWPHWKIIKPLLKGESLEIGPGTKPKLPVKDNYFIEISHEASKRLKELGGKIYELNLTNKLPFPSGKFDLICAFEVLEHLPNDIFVLQEINRVIKKSGICLVSFPLNMKFWNDYDLAVGHVRRYDPKEIENTFEKCGLQIVEYSAMDIPWPGKISGLFLSFLAKIAPLLVSKIGRFLDMRLDSALRTPIQLSEWGQKSYKQLLNTTTGFFILKKL